MKLLKKTVDLHLELLAQRRRQADEQCLLKSVFDILETNALRREGIRNEIASGDPDFENHFHFGFLETDRIFHVDQIRKICIDYRLRFLPSRFFSNGIPEEAVSQIRRLENKHAAPIGGFRIIAPSKTFRLKNVNDPLLFAPIGNGYYYLIHKWGDDLSSWRRILVWPYRNLLTFTGVAILLSLIVTWLTPDSNLSRKVPMAGIIIFLFAFKSLFAIGLYCFFMLGKKFNSSIWDSEYFN